MPTYAYKVRNERGKLITGTIDTVSRAEAISNLQGAGLFVTEIQEKKEAPESLGIFAFRRKPKGMAVAVFCRELSTMINAGVPLLRSMTLLADHCEDERLKVALTGAAASVRGGATLADAMRDYPKAFSELFVNTVSAGEAGGVLDIVLNRLADYLEKELEMKNKLRSAMTYPCILIGFFIIVVIGFSTFVLPRIASVFIEAGVVPPLPTRIVLAVGGFLFRYGFFLLGGAVGATILWGLAVRTESGRFAWDTFLINLPGIGKVIRRAEASRFAITLQTLIVSGVPLLKALEMLINIVVNKVVSRLVKQIADSVRTGEPMAQQLAATTVFPPMVADMVAVGEESGKLDETLEKVSDFFTREVDYAIKRLTAYIEPLILVVMGIGVAVIMMSILLPLFKMTEVIRKSK